MHLESIEVRNLRCLHRLRLELPPGRILVVGDNAQGKTTLLEAIHYLVAGRSFRTRYDQECLAWRMPEGEGASVRGSVRRDAGDSCRLLVAFTDTGKSVRIDDRKLDQLGELWGRLQAALFTPDDLQLVKGAPGERRRYLDTCLSQIDHAYLERLQRFNYALRQRNALLKRDDLADHALRREIAPWDAQLEQFAVPIYAARMEFIMALEPRTARIHGEIAGAHEARETVRLRYDNFLRAPEGVSTDDARRAYRRVLEDGLAEDRRRGQTQTGPHRDDMAILMGGKSAHDYASQGQARSIALALRLAQARQMHAVTGESPLLLLDDLASELDPTRKERVLELLGDRSQTFLTTTRREDFAPDTEFDLVIQMPPE